MNEIIEKNSGIAKIADLAQAACLPEIRTIENAARRPGEPEKVTALITRGAGGGARSLAPLFAECAEYPARKRGTETAETAESFIAMIVRHMSEHSALFASLSPEKQAMTAVIDYHQKNSGKTGAPGRADFGEHRICYNFPFSALFAKWLAAENIPMPPRQFSEWLEDAAPDFTAGRQVSSGAIAEVFGAPPAKPAEMLRLARGLKNAEGAAFARARFLGAAGGCGLQFAGGENSGKSEEISVPNLFLISIPLFRGGERQELAVRLRARSENGSAVLILSLARRPLLTVLSAAEAEMKNIAGACGLPLWFGAAAPLRII